MARKRYSPEQIITMLRSAVGPWLEARIYYARVTWTDAKSLDPKFMRLQLDANQ